MTESDPAVQPWLAEILRCPVTGAPLEIGVGPHGDPALVSTDPEHPLVYPIDNGVPVLLAQDARRQA